MCRNAQQTQRKQQCVRKPALQFRKQLRLVRENAVPAVVHSLDPLFRPESVAVIGASATPGSVGSILMRNLMTNGSMIDVDFADLIDYFADDVHNAEHHPVHGVRQQRAEVPQRRASRGTDEADYRRESRAT
jgi:hypothetical protein